MAQYWTPVSSATATQVLSQTASRKVERVSLYTKPSSVYMIVNVPYSEWAAGNEATYLEPPVLLVEQLMGNDTGGDFTGTTYVTGATFIQDTDASHLLADYMQFTVSYIPPGGFGLPFTAQVPIPMTALSSFAAFSQPIHGGKTAQQLIQDAHDQLVALAGA